MTTRRFAVVPHIIPALVAVLDREPAWRSIHIAGPRQAAEPTERRERVRTIPGTVHPGIVPWSRP